MDGRIRTLWDLVMYGEKNVKTSLKRVHQIKGSLINKNIENQKKKL